MIRFNHSYFLSIVLLAIGIRTTSSAAPEYLSGRCMNAAWQYGENSTTTLGCSANEVEASVVDVEGPSSCKEGEYIFVNVTTSIYFKATRYDFAVYTSTLPAGDPIMGDECALDVLGAEDAGLISGGSIELGDGDACYDVLGNGATLESFKFQKNLRIPCVGNEATSEFTSVFLQNCFAWRTNGQNADCETVSAYPGATSKCDCASLDLGIKIIGPTNAPSTSSMPTYQPSLMPSISTQPTGAPSLLPSISTQPSGLPTLSPSITTAPSHAPSFSPSTSTQPTSEPTMTPSVSAWPTNEPSYSPSISTQPTVQPTLFPSTSTFPTLSPSQNPSISTAPAGGPSAAPSVSTSPSSGPTMAPSLSSMPTNQPSEPPTITTAPSSHPTSFPSPSPSSSPTLLAGISGTVFEDLDNNGLMDGQESVLSNIPVRLYNGEGIAIQETTSNSLGHYQFEDVFPGSAHVVAVVTGQGFIYSPVVAGGNQMSQYDETMGTSQPIILTEGDFRNDVHAGVYQTITIGNKVWDDLNGNGIQDAGEPGVGGVEVSLRNGDGVTIASTVTDSTGLYQFISLDPGAYGIHFTLPSGYTFTQSSQLQGEVATFGVGPLLDDINSDADIQTGATRLVSVFSGDVNLSLDAGILRPASVQGVVWHDLNSNGILDLDEPGMGGVSVAVYNSEGEFVDMVTSDDQGGYVIDGLKPGSYYGMVMPYGNYFLSPMKQGLTQGIGSDFNPSTGLNSAITLQSGQVSIGYFDAGLWTFASVGNFIWLDTNGDGIQREDPLVGFPFPVTINLYDVNGQLLSTTQNDESGFYNFTNLVPGVYEIEFIPEEETDLFSPAFKGDDFELDSNVDPDTGRAQVYLASGDINKSIDAGIIAEAPYYPDWIWENQVCTNDGFDPEWMTTNDGQIYLYRNKEQCCENHFWWRIAQCMANEEYKFYRNGEICDTKIDFEDWELNSPADWTDTTLFDTKDECCANLFPYDYSGCMDRSPVLFKFEFCLDVGSLLPPIDCQTADIYANVMEDAINSGLGDASDANITRVGDATLTKVDGSTQCGGSLGGQGFINDLTGTTPDLTAVSSTSTTSICGVITTESYDCTQDACLTDIYDSIVSGLNSYINSGDLTSTLQSLATTRLPPVPELQIAVAQPGTLNTFNLLLPTTISNQIGELKYAKDGQQCVTKTAFATWETSYNSLKQCCQDNFSWKFDACCDEGGGCNVVSEPNGPGPTPVSSPLRYYANWLYGQLCDAKPANEFHSWEESFVSLQDCCDEKFSYDIEGCCASEGMGGCNSAGPPPTPVTQAPPNPATVPPPTFPTPSTQAPPTFPTPTVTTQAPPTFPTGTKGTSATVPSTIRYYATWKSGQLCDAKPVNDFENWEQKFNSLQDCCNEKFSYDMDSCCASQNMGGCTGSNGNIDPPPLRYYATWTRGQLCDAKYEFEDWEQPFDSLQDCCNEKFSYDIDGCCASEGMGGCV